MIPENNNSNFNNNKKGVSPNFNGAPKPLSFEEFQKVIMEQYKSQLEKPQKSEVVDNKPKTLPTMDELETVKNLDAVKEAITKTKEEVEVKEKPVEKKTIFKTNKEIKQETDNFNSETTVKEDKKEEVEVKEKPQPKLFKEDVNKDIPNLPTNVPVQTTPTPIVNEPVVQNPEPAIIPNNQVITNNVVGSVNNQPLPQQPSIVNNQPPVSMPNMVVNPGSQVPVSNTNYVNNEPQVSVQPPNIGMFQGPQVPVNTNNYVNTQPVINNSVTTSYGEVTQPVINNATVQSNLQPKRLVSLYDNIPGYTPPQYQQANVSTVPTASQMEYHGPNAFARPVANQLSPVQTNSLVSNPFSEVSDARDPNHIILNTQSLTQEEHKNYQIPLEQKKKSSKIPMFVLGAIIIVVVAGFVAFSLLVSDKSYVKPVKKYCDAFINKDINHLRDYILFEQQKDNFFPINNDKLNISTIHCSLANHEESYNDADLMELIRYYNKTYNTNIVFEEAHDVDINYSINYNGEHFETKIPVKVVKYQGKWYVLNPNN